MNNNIDLTYYAIFLNILLDLFIYFLQTYYIF
jgi:hypothetical protein